MADIKTDELHKAIKGILKGADLSNLSTKKVRKQLEEKFETDLVSRKKEIDKLVMKLITETEEEKEKEKSESEEEKEEETASPAKKAKNGHSEESDISEDETPKKEPTKSSSKESKPGKRKSAGKADDSEDPVMSSIKEMDDEDLAKRLQEEESGLRTRGARRAALAPPKPKKRKERDPNKKKTSVYNRPCKLSDVLAAVVGSNEMSRPEVVKTLWTLVKERNLQDPKNKQFICCDEELTKLFGLKRVKGFSMMKYLSKHISNAEDLVEDTS